MKPKEPEQCHNLQQDRHEQPHLVGFTTHIFAATYALNVFDDFVAKSGWKLGVTVQVQFYQDEPGQEV